MNRSIKEDAKEAAYRKSHALGRGTRDDGRVQRLTKDAQEMYQKALRRVSQNTEKKK